VHHSTPALAALLLGLVPIGLGGCCNEEDEFFPPPTVLSARFDYSMRARFEIPTPPSPEGEYEVYADGPLHPGSWPVSLNACGSTGAITRYRWTIDGLPVGEGATCDWLEYDFPAEGTYSVSLAVEDAEGGQASTTADVVVRDLLVFGVGDSYGSGEGNPDVALSITAARDFAAARAALEEARANLDAALASQPVGPDALAPGSSDGADPELASALAAHASAEEQLSAAAAAGPQWQNRRCHRSAHSGQVRAARLLEESDPHTSVTFVHLACSGARVYRGLLGAYLGIEADGAPLPPQIDRVRELADGHEIDALWVSIGGNDVNFAQVVESCIVGELCYESPAAADPTLQLVISLVCPLADPFATECRDFLESLVLAPDALDARALFDEHSSTEDVDGQDIRQDGYDDLPDNYRALASEILFSLGMDPGRVYLTEYPDVTRDESGQYCGWPTPPMPADLLEQLPGVSRPEMTWASTYVLSKLNTAVQTAAQEHGWHFVPGVTQRFQLHGYCSSSSWVVRLHESFLSQGDEYGVVHPNAEGHAAYAAAIFQAMTL